MGNSNTYKTIFITGGTGFLGSFVAMGLLRSGHRVIFLARNSLRKTAERRIDDALNFVAPDSVTHKDQYIVLAGDVAEHTCGLSPDDVALVWQARVDEVWHLAGSIAFSETKRAETYRINVVGLENLLALCEVICPRRILFTSTAYVCGDCAGTFHEDDLVKGQRFNNPYEETKSLAEIKLNNWAQKHPDVTTIIFRPSIVVGDSRDGKICGYSGYYTYMRTYHILGKTLASGKKHHVERNHEGKIILPVSVPGVHLSPLNIVTVDYAVELMLKLAALGVPGTYNITPDDPSSYGYWLEEGTRFLGLSGICVSNRDTTGKTDFIRSLEEQIAKGISDYLPYICSQTYFEKANVKKILGNSYQKHPEITPTLIATLLGYAVARDFKE